MPVDGPADDEDSTDSDKDPAKDEASSGDDSADSADGEPDDVPAGEQDGPQGASKTLEQAEATAAPARTGDGWQVDPYQVRAFGDAVMRARTYLDAVQAKVDRMQGAEFTPQLGTSPVGQQLAKKFDDRLNSADGLRARLAEAMKRMEDLVTNAEKVARSYEELEETSAHSYGNVEVKHG